MARAEKYTGLIYKDFERGLHVIDGMKIPESWYKYGAMDFGATNPTVYLWIAVDNDDNVYVYDEYYESEKTIESHANIIKAKTQYNFPVIIWGDPSAEQEMLDYANQSLFISPAVKVFSGQEPSWVKHGIGLVERLLKVSHRTGKPKLFVSAKCINTIREFETYRWMERKLLATLEENEKDIPLKANDHAMDALRYFVVSHFSGKAIGDSIIVQ